LTVDLSSYCFAKDVYNGSTLIKQLQLSGPNLGQFQLDINPAAQISCASITSSGAISCASLSCSGLITDTGGMTIPSGSTLTLVCNGKVSGSGLYFCAGYANSSAGASTSTSGLYGFTSSLVTTGIYKVVMSASHPLGVYYNVQALAHGYFAILGGPGSYAATSNTCYVLLYDGASNS